MRLVVRSCRTFALLAAVVSAPCAAQSAVTNPSTPLAPAWRLNFDVAPIGLDVGYSRRTSDRTSLGFSLGVGGNWVNYMALGGQHFAASDGWSYEPKDGRTGKQLDEILRAGVFMRQYFDHGRDIQVGLKASAFAHFDSSDDEPGGGAFFGLNATGMWLQWRKLQLGSAIDAGVYTEGRPEFGINVAPVLVRVNIP